MIEHPYSSDEVRIAMGDTRILQMQEGDVEIQNDMEVPITVVVQQDTQGTYVGIRRASIFEREEA
jgi:hypothetical protein